MSLSSSSEEKISKGEEERKEKKEREKEGNREGGRGGGKEGRSKTYQRPNNLMRGVGFRVVSSPLTFASIKIRGLHIPSFETGLACMYFERLSMVEVMFCQPCVHSLKELAASPFFFMVFSGTMKEVQATVLGTEAMPWKRSLRQWRGNEEATWDVLPSPACRWFQHQLSTDCNPMGDNKQDSSSHTIIRVNYKLFLRPLNFRVLCCTTIDKQNKAYYGEKEDNVKRRQKNEDAG